MNVPGSDHVVQEIDVAVQNMVQETNDELDEQDINRLVIEKIKKYLENVEE